METIGLVPVRNEAWVLPHSLAALSAFCDTVFVCDQQSTDASREVCRNFSNVVLLEGHADDTVGRLPQSARWRLLDAARRIPGHNLLWISDADELVSPGLARQQLDRHKEQLTPGVIVECMFYNLWATDTTYRDDESLYRPHWKAMAFVDDRHADYPRSATEAPLHEPRLPLAPHAATLRIPDLPVLHLQWLIHERNQMKQAWYRCIELLDGRSSSREINQRYSITLPLKEVRRSTVAPEWIRDLTFPDFAIDREPGWHHAEVLGWFAQHGPSFFESLEIWHIPSLAAHFRREVGRRPRPDRSYVTPRSVRARHFTRRLASGAWRRLTR